MGTPRSITMMHILSLLFVGIMAAGADNYDTDVCFSVSQEQLSSQESREVCSGRGGRYFHSIDWIDASPNLSESSKRAARFVKKENISVWIIKELKSECSVYSRNEFESVPCTSLHRYVCFFSNETAVDDGSCPEVETSSTSRVDVVNTTSPTTPAPAEVVVTLYAVMTVVAGLALILAVVLPLFLCRWWRWRRQRLTRGSRRAKSGASNHHVIVHQLSLSQADSGGPEERAGPRGQGGTPSTSPLASPLGEGEYWFFEQPDVPWGGAGRDARSLRQASTSDCEGFNNPLAADRQEDIPGEGEFFPSDLSAQGNSRFHDIARGYQNGACSSQKGACLSQEGTCASEKGACSSQKRACVSEKGACPSQKGACLPPESEPCSPESDDITLGQYVNIRSCLAESFAAANARQGDSKCGTWSGRPERERDFGSRRGRQTTGRGHDKPRPFGANADVAEPAVTVCYSPLSRGYSTGAACQAEGGVDGELGEPDYVRLAQSREKEGLSPGQLITEEGRRPSPAYSHVIPRQNRSEGGASYDVLSRQEKQSTIANTYDHVVNYYV